MLTCSLLGVVSPPHQSPKLLCWSPSPEYLGMWPYLEIGSLQMSLVKMRSYWSPVGPNPIWLASLWKGETRTPTPTHRGRTPREHQGRGGVMCQGTPNIASKTVGIHGGSLEQILPPSSWKEPTLPTPWSWTSSLWSWEIINFSCFVPQLVVLCYGS